MNYRDAIDYLFGIRMFGQQLGLERMHELLRQMGNPEQSLRFIHIAGTNGKGSVAAMTHAVLTAAGYRTGLYTSPHLVSVCERFQINGQPIAEPDLARLVERLKPVLESMAAQPGLSQPTFFEVVTALALQYFHDQNVDVVVWETGLGGRLDATNVVAPLVSIITNVAFDHRQYLGDTIPQIAAEKCGIIKPGVPVVTAATGDALAVIRESAVRNASKLVVVGPGTKPRGDYGTLTVPLLGPHQQLNCATAVAALEESGLEISAPAMRTGLARTSWPGRFQIVSRQPTVVLDGAHNPAGAEILATTLREEFPGCALHLVLGVLRDKDCAQICRVLAPLANRVFCVPVNSERTSDPAALAELCRAANPAASVLACASLEDGLAQAKSTPAGVVVITGSLFLIGEALGHLTGKGCAEVRLQ